MFDGRHCTQKDLDLLIKETNRVESILKKNIEKREKIVELQRFLQFLRRFDEQIANNLKTQIDRANSDESEIIRAIECNVQELKQNVIVDIYEHQK